MLPNIHQLSFEYVSNVRSMVLECVHTHSCYKNMYMILLFWHFLYELYSPNCHSIAYYLCFSCDFFDLFVCAFLVTLLICLCVFFLCLCWFVCVRFSKCNKQVIHLLAEECIYLFIIGLSTYVNERMLLNNISSMHRMGQIHSTNNTSGFGSSVKVSLR